MLEIRTGAFKGITKELIIELKPTTDELHLLVELENVVSPKKVLEKRGMKKAFEVALGEKTDSSSKFNDVFDVDFSTHPLRNKSRSQS